MAFRAYAVVVGKTVIVNTGAGELRYLAFSTRLDPEVVEYPDSNKYLATAAGPLDGVVKAFDRMHRGTDDLDRPDRGGQHRQHQRGDLRVCHFRHDPRSRGRPDRDDHPR